MAKEYKLPFTGEEVEEILREMQGSGTSSDGVFIARYDDTKFSKIREAYEAGKHIYMSNSNGALMADMECITDSYVLFSSMRNNVCSNYKCDATAGWSNYNTRFARETHEHEEYVNVFFAYYDKTTFAEIKDAFTSGKNVIMRDYTGTQFADMECMGDDYVLFSAIMNDISKTFRCKTDGWSSWHTELSGGGAGTWDELEGKPFIANYFDSVVWDGSTGDVVVGNYYLVNDATPVAVVFANGYQCNVMTVTPFESFRETHRCTADDVVEQDGVLKIAYVGIVIYEDGQVYDGNTFPKKGLYFKKDGSSYPVALTIPNFKGFISEKLRIDRLPEHNHVVRWEDVKNKPEVFGEAEVFYARYGETTYEEIVEAFNAGKFICATKNDGRAWAPLQSLVLDGRALFSAVQGAIVHTYECSTESVWTETLGAFAVQNHTHPSEVFYATYNVTSLAEIEEAYNAGKVVVCKFSNGMYNANLTMLMAGGMAIFTLFQDGTAKVMQVSSADEWTTTNLKLAKEDHNHDGVYAPAEHSHELPEHLQFGKADGEVISIFNSNRHRRYTSTSFINDRTVYRYYVPKESIGGSGSFPKTGEFRLVINGIERVSKVQVREFSDGYHTFGGNGYFGNSTRYEDNGENYCVWIDYASDLNSDYCEMNIYTTDAPTEVDGVLGATILVEQDTRAIVPMNEKYLPEHEHDMTEEINSALAEAKASGEFKGDPGYTPVKGTDYYTAADKSEMVNMVLSALPTWTGGSY